MSIPLEINIGSDYPLELAIALVVASNRRDGRCWKLRFDEQAFKVIRESAFIAVAELLARDPLSKPVRGIGSKNLSLSASNLCCNLQKDTPEPFAMCVSFLRNTNQPTTEIEEADTWRRTRQECIKLVKFRRAILIGTGPSLRQVNLRAYADALTIGCNKLYLLPYKFTPTHYVFEDRVVAEDIFKTQPYFGPATLWMPHDLAHLAPASLRYCLDRVVTIFPAFSTCGSVAYSGWTVMFVMLQIAFWMGVQEIFLVGVDGSYREPLHSGTGIVRTSIGPEDNHFVPNYYGPASRYQKPAHKRVAAAYDLANEVYLKNDRRIINCSVHSKITSFSMGNLPPPEYFYAT